ncbi:hypothetical protein RHIZO_03502 [Rhizobiaceae bacterium]|jgi:hypothetical protein|nr:hypothetical protein RHIZO_03502 [Rhizobiaceae bacterium]
MTKGKIVTRLTPAACEEIQTHMLEACHKVAADHGLVVESAGWRGMDTSFAFEPVFRVSVPDSDGTAFNLEQDRFEFLAEHYGLQPCDFGREFRTGSERFRITGIDPKRPRYPISAERIPDRRGFKFAAEQVAMILHTQSKP